MIDIDEGDLHEFLHESNEIENEFSDEAFEDACIAFQYGYQIICARDGKIKLNGILYTHHLLMGRMQPGIAGKLRTTEVMVGGRVCPKAFKVPALMDNWILNYGGKFHMNKFESDIKKAHIKFEKIHPFRDGNGRVGRIIMNLQRVYNDLPLLIIHTGKEQQEYYEWFK